MIDCMKLSKLGEKSSVWNVSTNISATVYSFGPVISPIIHASRFDSITSNVIDVTTSSSIGRRPIGKTLQKFIFLAFHDFPSFFFSNRDVRSLFYFLPCQINISPSLMEIQNKIQIMTFVDIFLFNSGNGNYFLICKKNFI